MQIQENSSTPENNPNQDRNNGNDDLNRSFDDQSPEEAEAKTDENFRAFVRQTKVLKDATLLKLTGSEKAGKRLVRALGSEVEDIRLVAGMGLVNGGENAVPAIAKALAEGANLPQLLEVADSLISTGIGVAELKAAIEPLKDHEDPTVAREARRILEES